MEFGKVALTDLDRIDFAMPVDGVVTMRRLAGERVSQPRVFVGGAKWGRTEWIDIIYPKGTREKDFLTHYVKHFNGIELNATHYKTYAESDTARWAEKAGDRDFMFCPKMLQSVTHYSNLSSVRARELTDKFLQGILGFGNKLGPVFIQLSERYTPARRDQLLFYLEQLPTDLRFCLEVRHPEWFENPEIRQWLFSQLDMLNIGSVITDVAGRRDCMHMEVTAPVTFIRFVGNALHPSDYERIDAWVERIGQWFDKGLQELHFYMHQPDELDTPALLDYFTDKLNRQCGFDLERPHFVEKTGELF